MLASSLRMGTARRAWHFILTPVLGLVAGTCVAQAPIPAQVGSIFVTATRAPQPLEQLIADVTILDAGRATLEINDPPYAEYIDEVEVGARVAGHIRVCFEVDDTRAATDDLVDAGARLIAPPTVTPWATLNSRLEAPAGL